MTAKEIDQKEYIKAVLAVCKGDNELRHIFFDFVQDLDYPRYVIVQAFEEASVNDDMSLRDKENQ